MASSRHARESGHPEEFAFPGFRVALAIASLPGMTIELCRELQGHHTSGQINLKSQYVGVGIMVTHNPLLRSGHAALLHPAPALGNDAKAFPGIRVTDANLRKPSGNMALHPSPRQVSSLTTPFKHAPPDPTHCQSKVTDRYPIHGHSVVPHVASHHRAQVPTHLWNGLVHALPKFFFDLLQLRLPSPAHRL